MKLKKTLIILTNHTQPSQLELDISERNDLPFVLWHGVPKALLPISSKPALTWTLNWCQVIFTEVFVVTDAHNYHYYERWAAGVGLPKSNILNCGFSSGPLSDVTLVERVKGCQNDVVVMAAEMLCDDDTIQERLRLAISTGPSNQVIYTSDIPMAVCFSLETLHQLESMTTQQQQEEESTSLTSMHWITTLADYCLHSLPNKDGIMTTLESESTNHFLRTSIDLNQYLTHWIHLFKTNGTRVNVEQRIQVRSYARVGLMGNPSDGFFGKTMSLLISNFWAQVTLLPNGGEQRWPGLDHQGENAIIEIVHRPATSPCRFVNMDALATVCEQDGYDHGDRLILACCKVFFRHCQQTGIKLDTTLGFRLLIDTNIPRQVGLAGSSAIITACWKALMQFYHVKEIPPDLQASLVLSVEVDELGIAAGLQDRVIQTYGGLVYMDFNKQSMEQTGRGKYTQLPLQLLPPLWLAYVADPEDSGKVHNTVKQRFLKGDPEIIQAMTGFASLTDKARTALETKDHGLFAKLMTDNFELRRRTYGDDVVGKRNLRMVEIVRQHGGHAKFSGSGGAIVISMIDSVNLQKLQKALEKEGYVFVRLTPIGSQQQ
ncbi:ribosomal protein S5 domain 2-type protein [Halteromyces radiatus]|uniref:ribosomal protein S5 domain 2-type protein n=1 Tax=Halteromyces radiatus TaxID=101107 RepID=UPI002220516C|nr:ribosomal protein S5 domain 2-type protein [Halteromyces radiatus]KAI8089344.1 ribosomal protein S5 domain 2-type protein [Halteromyces radiatus]